jgi:lysophospholipase L1-like esterase
MSTEHFPPAHHNDGTVQKTAHEIEHRYQIHRLRTSELKHGHSGIKDFKHDLKQLEGKLQADHILPHLHIDTTGKHIGAFTVKGEHHRLHDDKTYAGPESPQAPAKHRSEGPAAKAPKEIAPDKPTKDIPSSKTTKDIPSGKLTQDIPSAKPTQDIPAGKPTKNNSKADSWLPEPSPATAGDSVATQTPSTPQNGQGLSQLKDAIDRAKTRNRPLKIVQIGDSHIEGGLETPALAKGLSDRLGIQVQYAEEGIHGAKASDAVANPGYFLRDINKNTDLVVVSFGSNDSTMQAGKAYRDNYERLLDQIKTKAPNASIVMVGPTDGAYSGKPQTELVGLDSVTAEQRQAAATVQNGSYFDIRAQLGSIKDMNANGWMAKDNLHFTASGYHKIGDEIAQYIQDRVQGSGH